MTRSLTEWFAACGWKPFEFQRSVWKAIAAGESGLLHATTGAGKTYAVWLGTLPAFATPPKSSKPKQPAVAVPPAHAATKKIALLRGIAIASRWGK